MRRVRQRLRQSGGVAGSVGTLLAVLLTLAVAGALADVGAQAPDAGRPKVTEANPARSATGEQGGATRATQAAGEAQPAAAEAVVPAELISRLQQINTALGEAEAAVQKFSDNDGELVGLRTRLDELMAETQRLAETLAPRRQAIKDQIDKLGPLPAKDQPPEVASVAQERARLIAQINEVDAQVKRAELVQIRGRQLVGRIQDLRHAIFTRDLLRRGKSPLHPAIWREVAQEWPATLQELASIWQSWWGRLVLNWPHAVGLAFGAAALWYGLRLMLAHAVRRWQRLHASGDPTFFQRAGGAAVVALARSIPSAAAALLLYGGGALLDLFGALSVQIAESLLGAFLAFTVVAALASAIIEPDGARWRLFDIDDATARRLTWLVKATAAVYAFDLVQHDLIRQFHLSLGASIAATFVASLAFAALLIGIVRTPIVAATMASGVPSRWQPHALKLPLLALALVVIGASLLGYVALGRFLAGHVLLSGSSLILMFLIHLAIRALVEQSGNRETRLGRLLSGRFRLDDQRRGQIATALSIALNGLLALVGVPLLLIAWGFSPIDISRTAQAVVFGFEIGQFRISLARLLLALVLFTAVVFATRLMQRWMHSNVFPTAKFDAGVANSIDTGVGYAGFAIATLAAISYAGFDVSNFAIVAGALSVGIGFGLQSIVNNFVSGLILLVERPIKVGDWIVVKDREGIVRSISVRSTEIETFDRSSLIVPNSELIAGSVVNWTHRNSVGRLRIKVGVSYSSDPSRVRQILLQIADRHPKVLSHPKPQAVFEELGSSSLDFSLRVYLADIYDVLDVQTELRIAIVETFQREGIEIPFPQQDVRIVSVMRASHDAGERGATAARHGEADGAAPPAAVVPAAAPAGAQPDSPLKKVV